MAATPRARARARAIPRADGLALVVVGLAGASLLTLAVWGASPYGRYLDHGYEPASAPAQAAALALFLGGWALMIAATMLTTATTLLRAVARLADARATSRRLQLLTAVGFVGAWVAVGYGFRAADGLVHTGVGTWSWLAERPQLIGAVALLVAGAFQFTALKHRCLTACRSPRSFVYRHWHGERHMRDALRIGVAYGVSCVGCCWALMLVMFGLGAGSIGWMLGIGAVLAVEKNTAIGPRISAPLGLALLAAGAWVAL